MTGLAPAPYAPTMPGPAPAICAWDAVLYISPRFSSRRLPGASLAAKVVARSADCTPSAPAGQLPTPPTGTDEAETQMVLAPANTTLGSCTAIRTQALETVLAPSVTVKVTVYVPGVS